MVVEKSDVDISKLFTYSGKFEIKDRKGNVVLTPYIRLVGDAELNRARVFAIRKSAEMRAKLNTENSEERDAFVPKRDTAEKDILVGAILSLSIQTYTREALREAAIPPIPAELTGEFTLEEQEVYQKEIDNYPNKRALVINTYVMEKVDIERERLNRLSDSDLYTTYIKLVINDICEQEMVKKFREVCIYYGSFRDEKMSKPLFKDFDQFDNLPTEVKEQFVSHYVGLDFGAEELKK